MTAAAAKSLAVKFWQGWIKPFLVVLVVVSTFRAAVADWNDVPTGSMRPSIVEGDRIFVNKCAYGLHVPFTTWPLAEWAQPERFEVVVNLLSFTPARRVRLRVMIPEDDPVCPTLFFVYPGTENMEREAYDLMGIRFDGHPDPSRILMPQDWEGHPLRRDYSVGRVPVQFKGAPGPR